MNEEKLIPTGWRLVSGPARGGDKYWNAAEGKWYPITTNKLRGRGGVRRGDKEGRTTNELGIWRSRSCRICS